MAATYLSTQQTADYLGITRDALNHLIRSNDFIEPDVVLGEKGIQGWAPARVEQVYQQRAGVSMHCDTDAALELITEVKQVAEQLRGYVGRRGRGRRIMAVPTELYVVAARMESDIRNILVTDATSAANLASVKGPVPGPPQTITTTTQPVITAIVPADFPDSDRRQQISDAMVRLDRVIRKLPAVYASSGGRLAGRALASLREDIARYIDDLDADTGCP
ncbi:hypothetical protein VXE65_19320 [Mycolicibacterium conceptionense]|uniref:hypothetical protein n=1 Tax=Mycolicibacterium conceptionense TaxID=451644 RepID=UPI00320494DA